MFTWIPLVTSDLAMMNNDPQVAIDKPKEIQFGPESWARPAARAEGDHAVAFATSGQLISIRDWAAKP